jgi:ubiquinone/menaquinone biosynthesis C-methylase UbiE
MRRYSEEPRDRRAFTEAFDRFYTRSAPVYDLMVKALPVWKTWLQSALPHLSGPRVLEVSFGTGWLMTRYAGRFEVHGVDLNERMVATARENLRRRGLEADLRQGNVEALPYPDGFFDTVLNTMAFSGYPDARTSLAEMVRVLKPEGRLVLIDVNYPANGNWLGTRLTELWKRGGDLVRDMGALFREAGLDYSDEEIGGRGSIHLYVATRRGSSAGADRT